MSRAAPNPQGASTDAPSPEGLREGRCRELGPEDVLSADALVALLRCVPAWSINDGHLQTSYRFASWFETLAFVNALGWMAQDQDHHPDLHVSYGRCVVRFSTHSAGGITLNDFICAALSDALASSSSRQPA